MKYKKVLIILGLVLFGILIFNNNTGNKEYFTVEGVKLAVGVDGIDQSDFPNMGEYDVSVDCTNVTGIWNYGEWKLELSNMNGSNAACNINFTSVPNTHIKLNTKIMGLVGTTQGTGKVVNENGYRYEGKDPNNYVLFNGELWRIIGVFDSSTHGQSGNLTKIIKNDSIGSYVWNKNKANDWNNSSLNTILNTYYYNSQNGTGQDACYIFSNYVPGNCDFRYTGLNEVARGMIQSVTWKLGGYSSADATAETFYTAERGSDVYSGRPTTWTGNVGLMYLSDYGYSVLSNSCARTTNLIGYNNEQCGGQSWLLKYGYEWTMTPVSSDSYSIFLANNVALYLGDVDVSLGNSVRPTVYLKSSVYILSGDGSQNNPYVLGI